MELLKLDNVSFTYPSGCRPVLKNINLTVNAGEFVLVCGKSGCGKTTLLKHLKSSLAPHGEKMGTIFFEGRNLDSLSLRQQSASIGFVQQDVDNQLVTDKVWHELAFGLESLGYPTAEIRAKVAEMASFFGIETWFHKNVSQLSGGQKQLLNLASVMVMQPELLLLDEPTAQLDPIAAEEFLQILSKINRELGTTVILSEHRLEEAFAVAKRVVILDNGVVFADGTPQEVGYAAFRENHDMFSAFPVTMRVYGAVENDDAFPVTISQGRRWLMRYAKENEVQTSIAEPTENRRDDCVAITLKDVHFRYERDQTEILTGLNCNVFEGEWFAVLGGNGTGKTTTLSLIAGQHKPQRGAVSVHGKKVSLLPQNPDTIFIKKTVKEDLLDMLSDSGAPEIEREKWLQNVVDICRLTHLLTRHPYDLSGGEKQRAALAKILLSSPEILLLDEPTKGLDAYFKAELADILKGLKAKGVTILMVSHDVEFCAKYADRCALMFDGNFVSEDTSRAFFAGKSFYTTAANRMARGVIENAVSAEDIISACGKEIKQQGKNEPKTMFSDDDNDEMPDGLCIQSETSQKLEKLRTAGKKKTMSKRLWAGILMVMITIPLTIYTGIYFLQDRKYYFISLLVLLEAMLPFILVFEGRKPKARELVVVSVFCGLAVCGRGLFYMFPQVKPMLAIVILSGVAFGGETGFLVGAMSAFVSNFFFGQGPWTPWQMFTFGLIGFLAGVCFCREAFKFNKMALCLFGAFSAFCIYGGIMNPASVLINQPSPTAEMIWFAYMTGAPFDAISAVSTAVFLWFIAEPMMEKINRIKTKYGIAL